MDGRDFDTGCSFFVKIEPPLSEEDVKEEWLPMYLEKHTECEEIVLNLSKSRKWAFMNLPVEAVDAATLEKRIKKTPLGNYSITLEPTPKWNKTVVTGSESLIEDVKKHGEGGLLSLYLESEKFCPQGGDIASISVLPCQHAVIVEFKDSAVVKRLPEKHKTPDGSEAETRPLGYLEYVEGPDCTECKMSHDKESDQHGIETDDVKRSSLHDRNDEDSSSDDNLAPETTCNDDSGNEDLKTLETWSDSNTAGNSPTLHEKENASGSRQNLPTDKHLYIQVRPDINSILCKTIKYKKMPNWNPDQYKMVRLNNNNIEICCPGQENAVRRLLDEANTFGEVDLADYTSAADKLNCKDGIKWIEQQLDDLHHPVQVTGDKSSIRLAALNLDLAQAAATTIAQSLLPAKIKCNQPNQMDKFLKIIQKKKYILITEENRKSDHLKLLGIPKDVIEAVRNMEKHL